MKSKWKANYKHGSNQVFQMSQNLHTINKTRQNVKKKCLRNRTKEHYIATHDNSSPS
jgi:hypothetical protein